jgi:adenylosuccinate synthase
MKVDVILGLQWGDEGKGKIVDVLTPGYDIIARFQGGPNAGHTIEFNGNKFVLHTLPSGIFHDDKVNVIGNGVVIDPVVLADELEEVQKINPGARANLLISKRAHLILPTHRLLDAAYENAKGEARIGSTLKGISPAYTDKVARNGLRIGDIHDKDFDAKFAEITQQHVRIMAMLDTDPDSLTIDKQPYRTFLEKWQKCLGILRSLKLTDSEIYLNDRLQEGKTILAEGAQGSLLDIDFGSYPFVTSSSTTCGGVCTGLGIAPRHIDNVFGVFKAYCTRVGSGPFPTEQDNETGERLRREGAEFGATTGRPRRCGWLDLPALRYAVRINGVNKMIMTKADVLQIFDKVDVCTHYMIDGKEFSHIPYEICSAKISPVYSSMKGWKLDAGKEAVAENIPPALKDFIGRTEKETGAVVSMVSTGPDRKQIITT